MATELKTLKDLYTYRYECGKVKHCDMCTEVVTIATIRQEAIKWIKIDNDTFCHGVTPLPKRPWYEAMYIAGYKPLTHPESCVRDANADAIKIFLKYFFNITEEELNDAKRGN